MRFVLLFAIFLGFLKPSMCFGSLADIIMNAAIQHANVYQKVLRKEIVRETECSVPCGLGNHLVTRCFVDERTGKQSECQDFEVNCRSALECDLISQHHEVGQIVTLDCQAADLVGRNKDAMNYIWTRAPGIITDQEELFNDPVAHTRTMTISKMQESDAGSYRCEMHDEEENLVKVMHYALYVSNPAFMDLNVNRLQEEQKLGVLQTKMDGPPKTLRTSFFLQVIFMASITIGFALLVAVPLLIYRCYMRRKNKKQAEYEV
ncbi:transmembrane protein 81-like [Gastrophryne carolinensis]